VLVRPRFSTVNAGEITGYAVALRPVGRDLNEDRQPVWFGGGKLAPDLTLPRLRQRWQQDATDDGSPRPDEHQADRAATGSAERLRGGRLPSLTDGERQGLWLAAQRAVQQAQHTLHAATVTRSAGRDSSAQAEAMAAAMGASDVLHAVSRLIEGKRGGPLRDAAEHYDRASRPPRGRVPAATLASRALRTAARGMRTAGIAKNRDTRQLLQLMTQLAGLAETVAKLRETQQQAARASAARQAAEQLLHHVSAIGAAPATGTGQVRTAYFPQDQKTDHVVPGRPPAPTRPTATDPSRGHAPRGR
jgi:hypothetical protein